MFDPDEPKVPLFTEPANTGIVSRSAGWRSYCASNRIVKDPRPPPRPPPPFRKTDTKASDWPRILRETGSSPCGIQAARGTVTSRLPTNLAFLLRTLRKAVNHWLPTCLSVDAACYHPVYLKCFGSNHTTVLLYVASASFAEW